MFISSRDAATFFEFVVVYFPAVDGPVGTIAMLSLSRPLPTSTVFSLVKSSSAMSARSMSEKPSPEKLDLQACASLVANSSCVFTLNLLNSLLRLVAYFFSSLTM